MGTLKKERKDWQHSKDRRSLVVKTTHTEQMMISHMSKSEIGNVM
jgi:hypothetical protein